MFDEETPKVWTGCTTFIIRDILYQEHVATVLNKTSSQ